MANRRRSGVERKKGVCNKGWNIKSKNNPVASWSTSSKIQRKMEDNRIGDKELLVARSNERCRKICEQLWYVLENEKYDGSTSREVKVKWDTREIIDVFDGGLYHKVTVSSREGCDFSSMS